MTSGADQTSLGLLGGCLNPIGNGVAFLRARAAAVLTDVRRVRSKTKIEVVTDAPLRSCFAELDPMQMPWTTEMLIDCGEWTAYLNNAIGGSDISAIAPALARSMNVECVTAQNTPRFGPGHQATQLWLQGPSGEPPLMAVRTLAAHCQDGRWSWHETGVVQPFERPESYVARRVRDRLNRDLLIDYLAALGIRADDPSFFGEGVVIRQVVDWRSRTLTVEDWRSANEAPR